MLSPAPGRAATASRFEEWPRWVAWAQAGLALTMGAAVAADSGVENRLLLIGLFTIATLGWLILPLGLCLPPVWQGILTFGTLGVVNAAPERLGIETPNGHAQITLLAVVLLVGEAMTWWPLRMAVVAAVAGILIASPLVSAHDEAWPIWVASCAVALAVGLLMRALLSTIAELESAEAELTARAAAEERQRIARDVHDVIAHSLTVTMLHLTAARLAIGRHDPVGATEALEEAERAGRRSLADVRRTVGLLRSEQSGGAPASAPTQLAVDIDGLVADYRAAGVAVELSVRGDLSSIPPAVGIATYRTVQESLANVARHSSGATVTVSVHVGETTLIGVRSRGGRVRPQPGVGAGLLGMRERAAALGGRCHAGADADGWVVEVELPSAPLGSEVAP